MNENRSKRHAEAVDRMQRQQEESGGVHTKRHLIFSTYLDRATEVLEIVLSVIILIGFVVAVIPLVKDVPSLLAAESQGQFHSFLERALDLVIGIEFVRMLIKHTPGSVLDVLLFAIARHMILGSGTGVDNLLGVGAIAAIFAIRKFLFVRSFDDEDTEDDTDDQAKIL